MKKVIVHDKRSHLSVTHPVAVVRSFEHDQKLSPDETDTTGQGTHELNGQEIHKTNK